MSGSINKAILIGNLGGQPEIRNTQSGEKVATFSLATNESWKDQQGQRQDRTEWHRIVVFGGRTQIVEQYLNKGSKVFIEGKIRTNKWTNQQGQDQYTTEIVLTNFNGTLTMLDSNPNSAGAGSYNNQPSKQQEKPSFAGGEQTQANEAFSGAGVDNSAIGDLDDEIPF